MKQIQFSKFILCIVLSTGCSTHSTVDGENSTTDSDIKTQANLSFDPAGPITFSNTMVGNTGTTQIFLAENSGGFATETCTAAEISGDNASEFLLTGADSCNAGIAPNGTCSGISVAAKPISAGAKSASLDLVCGNLSKSVSLNYTAQTVPVPASLVFNPAGPITFSNTMVGSTSLAQAFIAQNPGDINIGSCTPATLSGANSSEFLLTGANSCNGGITAQGSCSGISVAAKPTSAGAKSASLNLVCGSLSKSVSLNYTAQATPVPASIVFNPAGPVTLPTTIVGSTSAAQAFVAQNPGDINIASCSPATLSGANSSEFLLSGATSCNGGILAHGSCSGISVAAKPTSAGAKSASLNLVCGSLSKSVSMSFTAQAASTPANLVFNPAGPVTLPTTIVGATSSAQAFMAQNTGSTSIPSCSPATLLGTNAAEFLLTGANSCNAGIAGLGTCSGISVAAKPTSAGAKSASLNLVCGSLSKNVALSFTASMAPSGTVYYISPTGNDSTGNGSIGNPWKTLFKATSTVNTAGSTIHALAGIYIETQSLNLAVGVNIDGDGAATTIIKSSVTGQWSVFLSLESNQDTNGNQSISNVTFDGQYVSESNNKTWWGIFVKGRSNVVIHDTKIINFRDRGVLFDGVDATDPVTDPGHYATGNKFYNNTVLNSAQNAGIYGAGLLNIGGQLGMEIYNNTMIQDQRVNFKNGWPLKYWDNGWLKGVKIYNNILTKAPYQGTYPGENGDWDFAIELFNIFGLEIYNNTIQGSIDLNYNKKGTYAHCAWIHDNIIGRAVANSNYESGIILEFRTEAVLIENNIFNNVSSGVQFNTRTISNNGGYPNPGGGTPTGGFSLLKDNVIRKNLFSNVYQGNGVGTAAGITVISEAGNDPQIQNLDIYNNTFVAKPGDAPYIGFDFTSGENGNATGVNIRNNIVNGFNDAWLKGSSPQTAMSNVVVTHNDAFGNGTNTPVWPGGNPTSYTYNNNVSVNPLFVGGNNYTLQGTSPLINAGVNIGLPYNGVAPDIGYAEY